MDADRQAEQAKLRDAAAQAALEQELAAMEKRRQFLERFKQMGIYPAPNTDPGILMPDGSPWQPKPLIGRRG